jgi:hypothetical protein
MPSSGKKFPSVYSGGEKHLAAQLLAAIQQDAQPYSSGWKADWLLCDIHSHHWIIADKSSAFVDGKWERERAFHWDFLLANGTNLVDPCNFLMLEVAQKIGFLWRVEPNPACISITSHIGMLYSLSVLIRWMYLHEATYDPARQIFSRLDMPGLRVFARGFLEGGVPWVVGYPWMLLNHLYDVALSRKPPESLFLDPFSIPNRDCQSIAAWLLKNDYYIKSHKEAAPHICRKLLSEKCGFELQSIKSHAKFSSLLQKFEPATTGSLVSVRSRRREHPPHKRQLLSDLQSKGYQQSTHQYLHMLGAIFRVRYHLPQYIPDSSIINFPEITDYFNRNSKPESHTPLVPLKIALQYTNEALKWVHLYGRDLVSHYLSVCQQLSSNDLLNLRQKDRAANAKIEQIVKNLALPDSLAALKIDGWRGKSAFQDLSDGYRLFRESPSLNDALSVYIGAAILLLSVLKPIRTSEVRDLHRNCIRMTKHGGYYLRQPIGKRVHRGRREVDELPIPYIVAHALETIDALGEGLRTVTHSHNPATEDKLFFVPDRDTWHRFSASSLSSMRICGYLDRFCDWVNIDCDEHGRRWYIRIHEARKSFLITFFWCFRYSSLEAARWIAGHSDAKEVYAYIETNFPGMELPAIEAQYASEQLRSYRQGDATEVENVRALERAVCEHFNVQSTSLLPEEELLDWLSLAFEKGTYEIQPYSVKVGDSIAETHICFRIKPEAEDA